MLKYFIKESSRFESILNYRLLLEYIKSDIRGSSCSAYSYFLRANFDISSIWSLYLRIFIKVKIFVYPTDD